MRHFAFLLLLIPAVLFCQKENQRWQIVEVPAISGEYTLISEDGLFGFLAVNTKDKNILKLDTQTGETFILVCFRQHLTGDTSPTIQFMWLKFGDKRIESTKAK